MKIAGREAIDIVKEFDLPFDTAFSHRSNYEGDNSIYFYANGNIVRTAAERSHMNKRITHMLDVITHQPGIVDWNGSAGDPRYYDIRFKAPTGELRGYYFRDINVAVMCDMTHCDHPDSRRMLAELTVVINELRDSYLSTKEGEDKS